MKSTQFAFAFLVIFLLTACESPQSNVHLDDPAPPSVIIEYNEFTCKGLDSEKGGVPVEVRKLYDDHCYPEGIFANPTPPDLCEYEHYHYTLISLDGHYRYDEDDPNCGAATSEDINLTGIYYTTQKQVREWNELWKQQGMEKADIDFILEDSEPGL